MPSMNDKTPPQIDPLMHAGIDQDRKVKRRPVKRRMVVEGEILVQTVRKSNKPRKPKSKQETEFSVDLGLLETLAICGKWAWPRNRIRFAIWHCLRATHQLEYVNDEVLWDRMGRWGSETRGLKESPAISERHMALGHLQRLLLGVRSASADPQRERVMMSRVNQDFHSAVLAWEKALAKYLEAHPDLNQSHDEFAGFVPMDNAPDEVHKGLLNKPKLRKPVAPEPSPGAQPETFPDN